MSPQVAAAAAAVAVLGLAALLFLNRHGPGTRPAPTPRVARSACTYTATPSTFAGAVLAAVNGQSICLASGDYGVWNGAEKHITVTAARGAAPEMKIDFGEAAAGIKLEHMSGMGGAIRSGAKDITISHSTFTGPLDVEGSIDHVVLDADHFDWKAVSVPHGPNAKIYVDVQGTLSPPALTVSDSTFRHGDLDGVHFGGGSGVLIRDNVFSDLCDRGVNHTDNIQFESGTQIDIVGNYVSAPRTCATQGITSYDGGTRGLLIEDNVVDVSRDWGIEIYSDDGSIVRHNTIIWHPASYAEFGSGEGTGQIDIDRKSQDPAGTGTQVDDNIVTSVDFSNGSTGTEHGNVSSRQAVYVGPLDIYHGYALSARSPVGNVSGSAGSDAGARIKRAAGSQS